MVRFGVRGGCWGLGFRALEGCLGFRVLGSRVQGLGIRV